VLDGVRGYYESCANRHAREPVPASLMSSIDSAVARVTAQGLADAGTPDATAQTSARHLRDALHALIGLRLSLFPATLQAATPPAQEASA
jgi:uncharacterized protein YchJ